MRNPSHTTHTIGMSWLWLWICIIFALLAFPPLLFSANVIMQSSDARIEVTVGGTTITLPISGTHSVDSIEVRASDFDVVITSGSLLVTSSGQFEMSVSPAQYAKFTCGSSESTLALHVNGDTARTITVTPKTTVCSSGGGGGGGVVSSGGGGGGGASAAYTSIVAPAPVPVVTATVAQAAVAAAPPSTELSQLIELFIALGIIPADKAEKARAALRDTAPAVSAVFTRGLGSGSMGEGVKRLQVLLNSDADTQVASSGVGSSGNETDYFGPATERAVRKFQEKYGIAGSGQQGYGYVGPKTRAKLKEVFGEGVPAASVAKPSPVATSVSPVFTTVLSRGMENADVKRLQQLLNSDADTLISSSGVGSPGNETNYYGLLTEKAVQKFQAKYGIISSGTPVTTGYGLVGPSTRSKLQEVFGQ